MTPIPLSKYRALDSWDKRAVIAVSIYGAEKVISPEYGPWRMILPPNSNGKRQNKRLPCWEYFHEESICMQTTLLEQNPKLRKKYVRILTNICYPRDRAFAVPKDRCEAALLAVGAVVEDEG